MTLQTGWEKGVAAKRIQWRINGLPLSGGREMATPVNGKEDRWTEFETASVRQGSNTSRSVLDLAWEEDLGGPVRDGEEIELNFQVEFSGREWASFFVSRRKQKYALARRSLRRLCFFGFEPFIHRLAALTSGIGCPSVSVGEVGYSFSDEILP